MSNTKNTHCPVCDAVIESVGQFDIYHNTKVEPCGHIIAASDLE